MTAPPPNCAGKSRQAKQRYDRWRDVDGVHVPDSCHVRQIDVDASHGALRSRLHKRAEVLGRTRSTRLLVRFDGERQQVSIRPHLVQIIREDSGG